MKKVKLKLLGLSYSQSQIGSYVLVLSEIKGDRKLPIIIKPNDAQYIALKMEGITTPRPLTQDLFKSITEALGAEINEVYIKDIVEGIFYAEITLSNMMGSHEIECQVGDAISLALLHKCSIYASTSVMNSFGIHMSDDGEITDDQKDANRSDRVDSKPPTTIGDLERMLEKAVEDEEYEIATQLRDRINNLKSEK